MIDSAALSLTQYAPEAVPWWVNVIGGTSGVLGLISHWPQLCRLWVGRQFVGLSALSCVLNTLTTYAWFAYGIGVSSPVQIVTNGAALVGALGILAGLIWLARPGLAAWLPVLAAGAVGVVVAAMLGGAGAVGWVASAMTLGMAVPQVVLLVRRRRSGNYDSSGVSMPRWALSVACNVGWSTYALFMGDRAIGVTAPTMTMLSVAVLVLCRPTPVGELPAEPFEDGLIAAADSCPA